MDDGAYDHNYQDIPQRVDAMLIYWDAMVHATSTHIIYNVYNVDEYIPITVILPMLSENSLPQSVVVLLEILSEVPRLTLSNQGWVCGPS